MFSLHAYNMSAGMMLAEFSIVLLVISILLVISWPSVGKKN